ncbi:MAG: hypothetical protein JXA19_07150 [Anaerolineales bacterium]|nr:hypothetical protein [Anaerolineales bacterium]
MQKDDKSPPENIPSSDPSYIDDTIRVHSSPSDENTDETVLHRNEEKGFIKRLLQVKEKRKIKPGVRWALLGLAGLLVLSGLGVASGYFSGMNLRELKQDQAKAVEVVMQFQLAKQEIESGQCAVAQQRLNWILGENPEYPGLLDEMANVLICLQSTTTPTPPMDTPVPTPSPTPDMRAVDDIYASAQALLAAEQWEELIGVLDTLRTNNPKYQSLEVDRMYFIAYRAIGEKKILGGEGDLEGGIYYLNQAEFYEPLDAQASAWRDWASWYITGASFWEVDWEHSVEYLSRISDIAPNLWDGSYFAIDRLSTAEAGYSTDLIARGDYFLETKAWCDADAAYSLASTYGIIPAESQENVDFAAAKCELNPDE